MDVPQKFDDIIQKISAAIFLEDLSKLIRNFPDVFGVANVSYLVVNLPTVNIENPLIISTYDEEWVRRYKERDYFKIDPVVLFGFRGLLPVDWSEVDRHTPCAQSFFADADRFSVGRHGITMPIRGPAGERALFTVTSNDSEADWKRKRLAYMREFQLLAHFFHDKAVQLSGLRELGEYPNLSGREMECLRGITQGIAPKQIAKKLNLSTSAVQIYLKNARRKLGCSSISEASAKATRLELFDI